MIHALAVLFFTSTQVVLSATALRLGSTNVEQCAPFTFSFTGELLKGSPIPIALTVIPFASIPVVVPLPNPQAIAGSTFSTILPYPEGTRFIASLEDGRGDTVIPVSDVMTVLPSQNRTDRTCLPDDSEVITETRTFAVLDRELTQCNDFTLSYNTTTIKEGPRVRVYNPSGFSFWLNQTSDDPVQGIATYQMSVAVGKEIVLLMDGRNGIRETSVRVFVGGDSSNSASCLTRQREIEGTFNGVAAFSDTPEISSKAIIIGSAIGGGIVVFVIVAMCIWLALEKKRKRSAVRTSFVPARMTRDPSGDAEKPVIPVPTFVVFPAQEKNSPTYPARSVSPKTVLRRESSDSWIQARPDPQSRNPRYISTTPSLAVSESRNVLPRSFEDRDRLSINSLDIEGMLNMATLQTESNRKSSQTTLLGLDPAGTHGLLSTTNVAGLPRRTLKVNSDIPDDLLSAYSRDSVNPFSSPTRSDGTPESESDPPQTRWVAVGLPANPRSGSESPRSRQVAPSPTWSEVGVAK